MRLEGQKANKYIQNEVKKKSNGWSKVRMVKRTCVFGPPITPKSTPITVVLGKTVKRVGCISLEPVSLRPVLVMIVCEVKTQPLPYFAYL